MRFDGLPKYEYDTDTKVRDEQRRIEHKVGLLPTPEDGGTKAGTLSNSLYLDAPSSKYPDRVWIGLAAGKEECLLPRDEARYVRDELTRFLGEKVAVGDDPAINDALRRDNDDLTRQKDRLIAENKRLSQENFSLKLSTAPMDHYAELNRKCHELDEESEALRQRVASLEKDNADLKHQADIYRNEYLRICRALGRRDQRLLQIRNLTTHDHTAATCRPEYV